MHEKIVGVTDIETIIELIWKTGKEKERVSFKELEETETWEYQRKVLKETKKEEESFKESQSKTNIRVKEYSYHGLTPPHCHTDKNDTQTHRIRIIFLPWSVEAQHTATRTHRMIRIFLPWSFEALQHRIRGIFLSLSFEACHTTTLPHRIIGIFLPWSFEACHTATPPHR